MNKLKLSCCCLFVLSIYSSLASASENWRLEDQLQTPEWFSLKVEHRTRYESYNNAFKKGTSGEDHVLSFRTTVLMEANHGDFRIGAEFIDSRIASEGENTPVNTTLVNEADLAQAYLAWHGDNLLGHNLSFDIKAGRQTMDVGSRRLVARNRFRNTLNNFTGFDTVISEPNQWQWRNFVVLPVSRLPNDESSLREGKHEFDEESFSRIFAGSFFSMTNLPVNSTAEVYLYYLNEEDTNDTQTKDRKLFTPGFRWFKKAAPKQFDFEIEGAVQSGTSYATASITDENRLDHFAYFGHVALGYTFDLPWKPQLLLQYDYASGDQNPNDGDNNRFDTLYGARRFEYGPTGIWGAFARSNINTTGVRLKFKPSQNLTGFIAHRAHWLAEGKDTWVGGGLRDETEKSGNYIGQLLEMRLRWKVIPQMLTLETGWAHLFKGDFAENAPDSPSSKDSDYVYFQTSVSF